MTDRSIQPINIENEMRDAYLSYAMSVIVSRALPDARDGLKPVHRRILYAMHDMGVAANSTHKKSARIVGEVLGKYHPHGDVAVYHTMVRMAQDFSMRYMLIDGQGNFGSIDGDGAAAMRYTEARMADIGAELLIDINKETVDFVDNFDGSLREPAVLPAMAPNLLVNGASGIAVGMSTNIPPHNLGEICDALAHMLENWTRLQAIDVDELMRFVKGPDFPTGGVIYKMRGGEDMLRAALATGRGKITLRAKAHIENMGRGKSRIIISELPFQTNKTTLIERIASLASSGKLEGLADMRDESDRQNTVRLVIELQRGVDVTEVMQQLFKLTPLQTTFGIIMLALVDGQPRLLTLKQALRVYLEHRLAVIQRRSVFDLARARERAHVLEGLIIALDNLDEVIKTIRKSRNSDTARKNLVKNFKVTEIQAQAILEMPLRRLASLEIRKIREEHKEKLKLIKSLEALLASPQKQRRHIADELKRLKDKYGDPRRTFITGAEASGAAPADILLPEEKTVVMLSVKGHLGRTSLDEPPRVTTTTKVPPRLLQHSTTAQVLYLFAEDGFCASLPVQQIPPVAAAALGTRFSDLSALNSRRKIASFICLPLELAEGFICIVTAGGLVKRIHGSELPGAMSREFRVMKLPDGDRIVDALFSRGEEDLVLASARGYAIRFSEEDLRATGLKSGGVRGMRLALKGDRVVAASLAVDEGYVWSVSGDGIAKASRLDEYKAQGRGGSGVISMKRAESDPDLAAATVGELHEDILLLTNKHKAKRVSLGSAKVIKRAATGGSQVISLREKERVVALTVYRRRIDLAGAALRTPISPDVDAGPAVDQPPRQYELSLDEMKSLLDEADGVDGASKGASENGADPDARADD
ncbi:MAG: DNA topoisomerase (ATP-hydrolyzing) subunit A [Chloroflexota bacterium]|nr:DNA topoisomerase (ATP-hydrolyzing) subunit A [Chloroflexota bacterium]